MDSIELVLDDSLDYFTNSNNNGEDEMSQIDNEVYVDELQSQIENEVSVEELLIDEIMTKPALWDSRLPLKERSKTIRDNLWLQIYKAFGEKEEFSVPILMKKWRNLRDTYVRVKGEMESYVPSGSGAGKKRKKIWPLYDLMSFLSETVKYRPTHTNVQTNKNVCQKEKSPIMEDEVSVPLPSGSGSITGIMSDKKNKVELAIVNALNRVNCPTTVTTPSVNPICMTISDLLSKMPLRERTLLEIELLNKVYEGAKDYL